MKAPLTKRNATRDEALLDIARRILNLETLESRRMDSDDFSEQSCFSLKCALEDAYEAGYSAGARARR